MDNKILRVENLFYFLKQAMIRQNDKFLIVSACVDIIDRPAVEIDFQCSMFYDVEPQ